VDGNAYDHTPRQSRERHLLARVAIHINIPPMVRVLVNQERHLHTRVATRINMVSIVRLLVNQGEALTC
jgi:hypothetical protein